MDRLDVREDRIKSTLFWVGEKLGRLKLNGELLQSSPLSRVVELEGLLTGVSGKLSLWRTLLELAPQDDRLEAGELDVLATRAEDQLRAPARAARRGGADRLPRRYCLTAI